MEVQRNSSVMSDYCLERLFDPEDLYYVPMEELIKRYKKRDLRPAKFYNIAKKYANEPEVRRRVIVAQPMEKLQHRYLSDDTYYKPPPKVFYCTPPNPQKTLDQVIEEKEQKEKEKEQEIAAEKERIESHYEWLKERKKLRNDLENMGLNMEYLMRKKDLTELERRVLNRMRFIDKEIQTDEIKEKWHNKRNGSLGVKPTIILPTPIAMQKIEDSLDENKWRLLDLFKKLDKDKDWTVQREDFLRECKKGNLEVSDAMIDELLMAYGVNEKSIDYKTLSKGRHTLLNDKKVLFKENSANDFSSDTFSSSQKRRTKVEQNQLNNKFFESSSNFMSNTTGSTFTMPSLSKIPEIEKSKPVESKPAPQQPAVRKDNQYSRYLTVPVIDTREDFYPTENKVNRATSAPSIYNIKISRPPSRKNTDDVNIYELISQFREKLTTDYENVRKSVRKIDENKLSKAYKYPNDTKRSEIIKKLKAKAAKQRQMVIDAKKEKKRLKELKKEKELRAKLR